MKKILFIMIMLALLTLIYSFKNKTEDNLTEQYIILKRIDNIEIRKYKESVNASYYSKNKTERNNYFRNLAGYIFGDNTENTSIDMTSPCTYYKATVRVEASINEEIIEISNKRLGAT